jgi:FkbM family methyltransferase
VFQHQHIWLPDGEQHFPQWMSRNGELVDGRGTYQIKKLREALKWVKQWRVAVDVGAHVGLWSMQLAKRFQTVQAFEPVAHFRDCFALNVIGAGPANVFLNTCALGNEVTSVAMSIDPADSGGTHVDLSRGDVTTPPRLVQMRRLDDHVFADVDFIKIDCEGYELEVLKGGAETLARCKPCVIVEQKPHKLGPNFGIKGTPAVDFLRDLGARLRTAMSGDYILAWD